jgi:hypothetical protein
VSCCMPPVCWPTWRAPSRTSRPHCCTWLPMTVRRWPRGGASSLRKR